MALNTNIALGVQPIQQQPNMLGQYAQVMAIKAAQQETEGYEGLRNALSKGVPNDPTSLLQYGKQGRATYESLLKGKKEQIDSAAKTLTMAGQIAGYVRDNPTPENFVSAVGTMVQSGVLTRAQAERVIADAGNDPTKIKSYAERTVSDALTEADRLSARTTRRGQDISASTTMRGQDITDRRLREQMAFDQQKRKVIAGEGEFLQTDDYGNVYRVEGFGPMRGPNAPAPAMPPAAANALTTAQPSINALAPTAQPQSAGPTLAAAAAMDAQNNIPRPKQPFTAPVPVIDKDGRTIYMQGRQAVTTGATPATPTTEKRAAEIRKLPDAIAQSKDALSLIDRMIGTEDGKTKPHKGFSGAVGAALVPGLRFVSGTSEADFQSMYDQIAGGAFLQAFETLKGGGQITEIEGVKGTAAINRMKLSTSETEFKNAARDFQKVLRRGIETAQKELRSGPSGGGAAADPLGIR